MSQQDNHPDLKSPLSVYKISLPHIFVEKLTRYSETIYTEFTVLQKQIGLENNATLTKNILSLLNQLFSDFRMLKDSFKLVKNNNLQILNTQILV